MRDNRRLVLAILAAGLGAALLVAGATAWLRHRDRQGVAVAREWARLAQLPASAANLTVRRAGGMFAREFVVTFNAPLLDINAWLARSPGTRGRTPRIEDGTETYRIRPARGAQFAEVVVHRPSRAVRIRVYWS